MWDVRLKYVKRQEDKNMDENVASLQISSSELTIDPQNPWLDDRLERKFFADHLTQIISGQVNPCVITINGEWGSGKTFLLKRWQCELLQQHYVSLYFNAWDVDSIEQASLALIGEVYGFLRDYDKNTFEEQINELRASCSKLFRWSSLTKFISHKVGDCIGVDVTSDTSHCLDEYVKAIEQKKVLRKIVACVAEKVFVEYGKPFVFIVDELDRCRPVFAIEILESIKHIFNVPHCIFVLGVDRDQLQQSIRAVYGDIDSLKYLERFFDLDMRLSSPNIRPYFTYLYNKYFPKGSDVAHYIMPGNADGRFRISLLHICEYYQLNLREMEIVFKTFIAVLNFQEIQQCSYPILLAVMIVVRLKAPTTYLNFVNSTCNPREVIDLPFKQDEYLPRCFGFIMASVYDSYLGSQYGSPFDNDINKLLQSKLWDVEEPKNDNSTPESIIPRFVTEALACREQVIAKSNRQSRGFNYALNFLNPIAEYDTPKMRDKTLLARYIDMIA